MTESFEELVRKLSQADKMYIVSHRRADPDSLVTSYILHKALNRFVGKTSYIVVPEGVPKAAADQIAQLLSTADLHLVTKIHTIEDDEKNAYLFVDVGGIETLADFKELLRYKGFKCLFDHHIPSSEFYKMFDMMFVDPNASSTLEIVLSLLMNKLQLTDLLSKDDFRLILKALLVETNYFRSASWLCLCLASIALKELGGRLSKYFPMERLQAPLSERIAVLKSYQRLRLYRYGEIILGISHSSSYHNKISHKLVNSGLDIAIVYSVSKDGCKLHMRVSDVVAEEVAPVIREVTEVLKLRFNANVGGHRQVINFMVPGITDEEGVEAIFSIIMELFSKSGMRFQRVKG